MECNGIESNRELTESKQERFWYFHLYITLSKITDKDINFLKNMPFKNKVIAENISNIVKIRGDFSFILTGDNLVANQPIADVYIETCSLQYYQLKQQLMECRVNVYTA